MNKAFTLIELVFVIIVIGILSSLAMSNFNRSTLIEAANQLVSHIRYTQHLAMMDNQFDSSDANWFKGRWQILFSTANDSQSYIIFSDTLNTTYEGNPNGSNTYSEVAKDITKHNVYLAGTTYSSFFGDSTTVINDNLNLKKTFGVNRISVSGGSSSSSRRIFFDNLGRPYKGYDSNNGATRPFSDMYIANSRITITLCSDNPCSSDITRFIKIVIEPETGYVHIL